MSIFQHPERWLVPNIWSAASQKVMQVMDQINVKWGRGTMRPACAPVAPDWGMKREMLSPSYTTRIDQLWKVKCS
ncbi:DUF4113 domain-containing protein [Pseudomonas sp. SWRI124]|nr:DUF4113 domain-containing protein [Pseudomonas khavaziana]